MSPVYHWRPQDRTGEYLLPRPPVNHHPQSQEPSVVLTVDTDLLLINWVDGLDGS